MSLTVVCDVRKTDTGKSFDYGIKNKKKSLTVLFPVSCVFLKLKIKQRLRQGSCSLFCYKQNTLKIAVFMFPSDSHIQISTAVRMKI